jgi:hypothetical protein
METTNPITRYVLPGVILSAAFTIIIALTAANLTGFEIVGKTVPFAYAWRLTEPTAITRLAAWSGYLLHNIIAWAIIYLAQRQKPKYDSQFRWFNWGMVAVNLVFIIAHILQTRFFYDGLAQDVPEISALGSVALMLIVILILETPRRGLLLGKKVRFQQGFMQIVRQYHGYLFSWAIIYTFWYHPTEGTLGHLMGFFYMFTLFTQSVLIFNRAHINKWWTVTLEVFVLIHGVAVAVFQGNEMWPMFAFGFGAMIVLTQMYGLGLSTWTRRGIAAAFIVVVAVTYGIMGRFGQLNEVIRIPMLDYLVVFLIYGLYLGLNRVAGLFRRSRPVVASTD